VLTIPRVVIAAPGSGHGKTTVSSAAALLHGFATYDPGTHIGGVIFNKAGSEYHERLLRDAADAVGIPVLGVIHRRDLRCGKIMTFPPNGPC
jgi:cobyrinic acid a,c-diamide synthase